VYQPTLEAGRRFAAVSEARGAHVLSIEGDLVRFARPLFERKPAVVVGVTRWSDAVLIEDVGRETGYLSVAVLRGPATTGCIADESAAVWPALCRMAKAAGDGWIEALADFAVGSTGATAQQSAPPPTGMADSRQVTGWVLAPKS
jgi:hypothetical protein